MKYIGNIRVRIAIGCDPVSFPVNITKIILQPIVENALYHGIRGLDRQGCIHIRAEVSGDQIIFTVEGFDADTLSATISHKPRSWAVSAFKM